MLVYPLPFTLLHVLTRILIASVAAFTIKFNFDCYTLFLSIIAQIYKVQYYEVIFVTFL